MPPLRPNALSDAAVSRPDGPLSGAALRLRHLPVLPVFTCVLWLALVTVGALGLELPYMRPKRPPAEPAPVVAETLRVDLTDDPTPTQDSPPPRAGATPATTYG